jgi:hypothetical protein
MCDAHLDIALLHLGSHQTHLNSIQLNMLIQSLFTLYIHKEQSLSSTFPRCLPT